MAVSKFFKFSLIVYELLYFPIAINVASITVSSMYGDKVIGTLGSELAQVVFGSRNDISSRLVLSTRFLKEWIIILPYSSEG